MRTHISFLFLSALLISACDSSDDPVTNGGVSGGTTGGATGGATGGTQELACSTDEDCADANLPNISIWYATCSDMVLQTPTGSGLPVCGAEGMCVIDFDIVNRDCAAEGLECRQKEDEQGDDCFEPVIIEG